MGITEAVAALESAALMSRSKAVQDLVGLVLSKLEGLGDRDTKPDNDGPLTNAEKCRRYRQGRDTAKVSTDTVRDTAKVSTDTTVSLVLSSLSSSPDLALSLSDSPSLEASESTGAREDEPTPSLPESRTQRVANVRGTRVPKTDAAPEELAAWAERWECDTKHPEWPKFLDHWRSHAGQRGVRLDWGATWRNWVRRAPGFAGPPPRAPLGGMQPAPATGRLWKVGQ